MRGVSFATMGVFGLALAAASCVAACGDSDGGDDSDGMLADAGVDSGSTGGTGGSGGSGGTGGGAPTECVDNHFDGVTEACATCMCNCNPTASECGEKCWELSNCVYFQCQMMGNRGLATEMECTDMYCSGYYDTDSMKAAEVTPCFQSCGPGDCVAWWTMQVPVMGMASDGGTEDAGQ